MSELKLDQICPQILEPKLQDELTTNNGLVLELDTSIIQANHPLENENDESFDEE